MADPLQIVQSSHKDIFRLNEFLENARLIHRHLDWHPLVDWIDSEPFLLLQDKNEILHAVLALPPDPPQIAWVHCFAVDQTIAVDKAWRKLFTVAAESLQELDAHAYAVGLEEWFTRLLLDESFRTTQNIVVLSWNHHLPAAINLPVAVFLRPMEQQDLPQVAAVDAASFEPVWVNSPDAIRLAYLQSERSTVAEVDGKIIGYELTTANQYSAHLSRLAVLPEFRHRQIGTAMVREMLAHFARHGMVQITVNTQSDNSASLHVYKSLGFEPTFEEYPVLSI